MALQSSGYIRLAGNDTGRSVAKELNLGTSGVHTPTISLGQTNVRALAQRTGSVSVGLGHLRGKSNALETQTVTVGYNAGNDYVSAFYGTGFSGIPIFYDETRNVGSCSDGTLGIRSNKYILNLKWQTNNQVVLQLQNDGSTITNAGFTTMSVGGQNLSRSSATFAHNAADGATGSNNHTSWVWSSITTNPFGTTTNATKAVVFS